MLGRCCCMHRCCLPYSELIRQRNISMLGEGPLLPSRPCSAGTLLRVIMIMVMVLHAAGDAYLMLDRSLHSLVDFLAKPLAGRIHTNWPVHRIAHDREGAVVFGPHGQRLSCRHVLVTASLAVLQSGMITFEPPLPQAKQGALARLRMSNAIKVQRARDASMVYEHCAASMRDHIDCRAVLPC